VGCDGHRIYRPADGGGRAGRTGGAFYEREGLDTDPNFCADYAGDDAGDVTCDVAHPRDTESAGEHGVHGVVI
jgi:hypothetical protein